MGRSLWVRPVARRQCRPREKERAGGGRQKLFWEEEGRGRHMSGGYILRFFEKPQVGMTILEL